METENATDYVKKLRQIFPEEIQLGLLHGQMKPAQKNKVMEAFMKNEVQVLVATTVVEVGVNVPNATVMMIENAERFGLAQLHQLRGRVGSCLLYTSFLMAFVFAFILLCNIGYDLPVLAGVTEGYPAEEAGMQAGDTILKIDHTRIHFFRDISAYTQFHSGDAVTVTYERDGERYQTVLTPKYNEEYGYYMYGFQGSAQKTKGSVLSNLKYSVYEVEYWIRVTIDSLKSLVGGKVSVNDMSGPVGICLLYTSYLTQQCSALTEQMTEKKAAFFRRLAEGLSLIHI